METQYQNRLTDEFLHKSVDDKTREHNAIEILLKGPEIILKDGGSFLDSDQNPRCSFRLKWWDSDLRTFGDAAMIPENALLAYRNSPLSDYIGGNSIISYPKDAPPVVFGHYSKKSFGPKAACLDYGIIKGKELAALRWDRTNKDKPLSEMEIPKVRAKGVDTNRKIATQHEHNNSQPEQKLFRIMSCKDIINKIVDEHKRAPRNKISIEGKDLAAYASDFLDKKITTAKLCKAIISYKPGGESENSIEEKLLDAALALCFNVAGRCWGKCVNKKEDEWECGYSADWSIDPEDLSNFYVTIRPFIY